MPAVRSEDRRGEAGRLRGRFGGVLHAAVRGLCVFRCTTVTGQRHQPVNRLAARSAGRGRRSRTPGPSERPQERYSGLEGISHGVSHIRPREIRQQPAQRRGRTAGPGDDDEMAPVEDGRIVLPGSDVPKRVGARDEEERRPSSMPRGSRRSSVAEVYDGPSASISKSETTRPGRSCAASAAIANRCAAEACGAPRCGGTRAGISQTTSRRRRVTRGVGDVEMAEMDRDRTCRRACPICIRQPRAARCARPRATSLRAARASLRR